MGNVLVVVVGIAMVLTTAARVQVWSGPERGVWHEAVAHSPQKPRPWVNLGRMYAGDGADALAEDAYRQGYRLAVQPDRSAVEGPMRGHHVALLNLALLRATQGRFSDAFAFTAAIQPRNQSGASLVDRLEAQWRQAEAAGSSFSGF